METKKQLPTEELHTMKALLRTFEYHEYRSRGYKWINGAFSKATITDFDDTTVRFLLTIGVQDGHENSVYKEHYKLARTVITSEMDMAKKIELIEEDDGMPFEVPIETTPEDKLKSFKIQGGAIVLPEGMKGKDIKQVNKVYKLKLLKRKTRLIRKRAREEFHDKHHRIELIQLAEAGKLTLIRRRKKNKLGSN